MPNQTEILAEILRGGGIVFFGGAGVSTESGIPDFRSETGLYSAREVYGYPPEELLSHTFFKQRAELFFRYYRENLVALSAKPNRAHLALAQLESRGLLDAVVTQNIDGLHQAAGSRTVYELHGSNLRQYCERCGKKFTLEYVMRSPDAVPGCDGHIGKGASGRDNGKCGGTVRPDVVLYEEGLDDETVSNAVRAISRARTLIVGGTSLAVYPAAGLLRYFKGGKLVLINKSATSYDDKADLLIREPIGETLGAAAELL